MRILIASDKFKGSMTAAQACEAIRGGIEKASGDESGLEISEIPIADGGEGIAAAITDAKCGEWVPLESEDALGRPVEAGYGWIESESLAVVEMAEASGLWRIEPEERDPWRASTSGTGILIRDAIETRGAGTILLGIGGSATNDGGSGVARALGVRFLDADGREVEDLPAALEAVERIERGTAVPCPHVLVACDVTNPLLGENGCTRVYGSQKGISEPDVDRHEGRLHHLVSLAGPSAAVQAEIPGAGAAGGLGFGCLAFLGAELRPGFDLVSEILGLEAAVRKCDLVVTGEGRLDSQTLQGKGPAGIARLARRHGKPVAAFAGIIEAEARDVLGAAFDAVIPVAPENLPVAQSMARGPELLGEAAFRHAEALGSLGCGSAVESGRESGSNRS